MMNIISLAAINVITIGLHIRREMFDKDDDEIIGFLEDKKAIVWDGVAPDGQAVFRFDLDRLKEVMPELHKEILADIDNDLMELYRLGYVEIEYDEELNAMFRATEKGREWAEQMGFPPFPLEN
jgi:hypothetical protein